MTTRWKSLISQSRLTLVLALLVGFTLLHGLLVWVLRTQVRLRLEAANVELNQGYRSSQAEPGLNAYPYYEAAWNSCLVNSIPEHSPNQDVVKAYRLVESTRLSPGYVDSVAAHPDAARRVVQYFDGTFRLLQSAHDQPQCDYELTSYRGFLLYPNCIRMRNLSNHIALRAALAVYDRNWALASHTVAEGLRFVRRQPELCMLSLQVQLSGAEQLAEPGLAIPAAERSPELRAEAAALADQLSGAWAEAVQGEKRQAADFYELLQTGAVSVESLNAFRFHNGTLADKIQLGLYRLGGQPMVLVDELAYLNWTSSQGRQLGRQTSERPSQLFLAADAQAFEADKIAGRLQMVSGKLRRLTNTGS